jgi:subtilisin family serine protease
MYGGARTTNQCGRTFGQRLALGALALLACASIFAADRVMLGPEGGIPVAAQGNAQTLNALGKARALAASAGSVRLIVGLRAAFAPEGLLPAPVAAQQRSEIGQMRAAVLAKLPFIAAQPQAQKVFETIPFLGLIVSPAELEALAQMPEVTSIEEDPLRKPSLSFSVPHIGAGTAWTSGYTGAGQVVAVLDTGVDKNHPFLAGKVVSEACYSSTSPGLYSSVCPGGLLESTAPDSGLPCGRPSCGHGTHVAGIVAGRNGPSSLAGVAIDASLISVQVYTEFWTGCGAEPVPCLGSFASDEIKGLERVLALQGSFSISAVNMSLGDGRNEAPCDNANLAEKAAIDNLRAIGIATVISAGNDGYANALTEPACISSAISVGSTWARAGWINDCLGFPVAISSVDSMSCFSNSAYFLNLLAPGSTIKSSVPGADYVESSGTSMAAPHVAGAWAVMKQKKPTATVSEVLGSLVRTGRLISNPRNGIVTPRIDLAQAVASLGSSDITNLIYLLLLSD